jgi:hypothetical protein
VAADALEAGTEAKLEGVKQKLHMATIQERITDFVLKHSAGPFLPSRFSYYVEGCMGG